MRRPPADSGKGHGKVAVVAALLANLGIAVAKFAGFLITGASSMLAEAFHSVADSGNQAMLLFGAGWPGGSPTEATRSATARPLLRRLPGRGRAVHPGSLFSFYEGYQKLRHPHELESPAVALAILVVALVLEGCRCAPRSGRPAPCGAAELVVVHPTTKQPELAVVLLEDTAAELGLGFALLGSGWPRSPATGCMTPSAPWPSAACWPWSRSCSGSRCTACCSGGGLPRGAEAVRPRSLAPRESPGWIQLRTMHLGPEELLVAARVELDPNLSADDAARVIDQAQAGVARGGPNARIIYLEPELPAVTDPARDSARSVGAAAGLL
jgi:hypothetical protein